MPAFLALGQSLVGTIPRVEGTSGGVQEEGTFVQAPSDNHSSGQGQAKGPVHSPLPSSFSAPGGMCPLRLTSMLVGPSSQRGLCPAPNPSEAPIVRQRVLGAGTGYVSKA